VSYFTDKSILTLDAIEQAGGLQSILKNYRAEYFRYLKLVAEVYGVLKLTAESEQKVCKA
jgi:hypothetical protein